MKELKSEMTHRGVKIAIIRALCNWREEESKWQLLLDTIDNVDWRVALQTIETPVLV